MIEKFHGIALFRGKREGERPVAFRPEVDQLIGLLLLKINSLVDSLDGFLADAICHLVMRGDHCSSEGD